MNTTSNHESGFRPQLSRIIYVVICLGVLILFIFPLLILLLFNLHIKPFTFTVRKQAVTNDRRLAYFKLADPLQ
ncbi:hypothetical protein [Mucilaginibacter sp.]|uniref:hypothetical protein n=1 Tax=Mucilaginibacter sp. TaxID=1882438 RepID=UPI0032645AD6